MSPSILLILEPIPEYSKNPSTRLEPKLEYSKNPSTRLILILEYSKNPSIIQRKNRIRAGKIVFFLHLKYFKYYEVKMKFGQLP